MALAQVHRPTTLAKLAGNAILKKTLNALLERKDKKLIPKCFAFYGESGCGKTTVARIVAKELGCPDNEFYELNAASVRGIDTIRDMEKQIRYAPMSGGCRIWLLDEVHQYPAASQEALLKMFEECPPHVYFMICTTNPEKLKPALKNRCVTFEVTRLTDDDMFNMLADICDIEDSQVPDEVLDKIVATASGSSRNALQMLEKIIDLDTKDMKSVAMKMEDEEAVTKDLIDALLKKKDWKTVAGILKRLSGEAETTRYGVLNYCNAILMNGTNNPQCALIMECFSKNTYDTGKAGITLAAYSVICG